MIKEFIGTGKTIEEATAAAKAGLNAPLTADVRIEVIEMPKKKILGLFGGSDAKVKASYNDGKKEKKAQPKKQHAQKQQKNEPKKQPAKKQQPKKEAPVKESKPQPAKETEAEPKESRKDFPKSVDLEYAKAYLSDILKGLNIEDAYIEASYAEGVVTIDLECSDYGIIIGRRGETLDSIQYLLCLAMKKRTNSYVRVTINIGDYRERRNETLRALARKHAAYVLRTGRRYTFEPMNPYERRVIHTTVQEIEGAESRSIGFNQDRRVVIEPVGGAKPRRNDGYRRGGRSQSAPAKPPVNRAPKADRADLPKFGKIEINK